MKANKKISFHVFLFFSNAKILDYSHLDNEGGWRGRLLIHRSNETINNRIDDKREEWREKKRRWRGNVSVKQKYRQIQKEKDRANWVVCVLDIAFDNTICIYILYFQPSSQTRPIISTLSINGWKRFRSNLLRRINLEVDQFRRIKSFHPSRESEYSAN